MPRFYYQTSSLFKKSTGEDPNFKDLITFTIKGEREKPDPALFHWCKSRFTYLIAEFCSTYPILILRILPEVVPICNFKLKKPLNSWFLEAGKILQGKYYSVLDILPRFTSKCHSGLLPSAEIQRSFGTFVLSPVASLKFYEPFKVTESANAKCD